MVKPPKNNDKVLNLPTFVDLPILTEAQVTETTILPVLTEALAPELQTHPARPAQAELPMQPAASQPAASQGAALLSEAQYSQLAARIAPQLEALLREKLSARLGSLWKEIWSETQAELPSLIRAELEKPAPRSRK